MDRSKLEQWQEEHEARMRSIRERHGLAAPAPKREETEEEERRIRLALLREVSRRRMQALKLYEPTEKQLAFHKSKAAERLALGGNRGTKTMCAAAEVAWAATGTHPYHDYPKESLKIICVAKDGLKIGQVFYAKLFKAGAFKMIKGEDGFFRAYRPWEDGWDAKTKPALPLIPPEMIADIAWEDKKLDQPKLVKIKNGDMRCEFLFCTSAGRPVEGVDVDVVWFDEEVYEGGTGKSWYTEMAARLIDRRGRFIWSATPQAATDILWKLHTRALESKDTENPAIEEFHFTMDDNPYLTEEAKAEFREKAAQDPDEYRVRVKGEFLVTSHLVYPNFKKSFHTCAPFEIPANWTRYFVLDPGFGHSFGTFLAVPPPGERDDQVFVYDELYRQQCDAMEFTDELRHKMSGQFFEEFLIDLHGSIRSNAFGKNEGDAYVEAFRHFKLRSISTGNSFKQMGNWGNTGRRGIVRGEVEQVRRWLWPRADKRGTPKLQIFETCHDIVKQLSRYRNKLKDGKPTDDPDPRYDSHGCDTIRYAVLHGMAFVERTVRHRATSTIWNYYRNKMRKKRKDKFIHLGPGD